MVSDSTMVIVIIVQVLLYHVSIGQLCIYFDYFHEMGEALVLRFVLIRIQLTFIHVILRL